MLLALDSLKFYKLKNERVARLMFLFLYLLYLVFAILPFGNPLDDDLLQQFLSGDLSLGEQIIQTNDFIYFIVSLFIMTILGNFFSIMYATIFVNEFVGISAKKSILDTLKSIPLLLLAALVMLVPYALALMLLIFPFLYLYYAVFFSPLLITEGGKGVFSSLGESFYYTRGFKFRIFMTQILLTFILNIPSTALNQYFYSLGQVNGLAFNLIHAFISAASVMILGRFIGHYYIMSVKLRKNVNMTNNKTKGEI